MNVMLVIWPLLSSIISHVQVNIAARPQPRLHQCGVSEAGVHYVVVVGVPAVGSEEYSFKFRFIEVMIIILIENLKKFGDVL